MPASGTESRISVTPSLNGIRRWTASANTMSASTTIFTLCE